MTATVTATTFDTATTTDQVTVATRRAWRHGLVAGALASLATFAIAAIADAAGVSFVDETDKTIPLAGFPEFTMLFTLIGIAIAARMAREPSTHSPRSCAPPSPSLHCRSSPTS